MKKKTIVAFSCLLGLIGCQPSETDINPVPVKKFPVQFSICLQKEVLPLPLLHAMPALDIPEPVVSDTDPVGPSPDGTETEVEKLCTAIEYVVYNTKTPEDMVLHRSFTKGSEDFGIVYDSLPAGNYRIAFLAHSSVCKGLSEQVVQFDGLSDSFWWADEVSVGDTVNTNITLKRIVGKIEFASTEAVPVYMKHFDMEVNAGFDKLNILTGKGVSSGKITLSHTFTPGEMGKTDMKHGFLTFIPSDNTSLQVTLTAFDTNEAVVRKRDVKNITPIASRIIRYSGKLYSKPLSDDTFSLSIEGDGKWEEEKRDLTD